MYAVEFQLSCLFKIFKVEDQPSMTLHQKAHWMMSTKRFLEMRDSRLPLTWLMVSTICILYKMKREGQQLCTQILQFANLSRSMVYSN